MNRLPIDEVLPEALSALKMSGALILSAPPGSGKTTRLPLAIANALRDDTSLEAEWGGAAVLVLQPRRLAARAVAEYMASLLGERAGERVGYQVRFERAISAQTQVQVLTEGLLTKRLALEPELEGVGCVILDEFHERSLHADLALALLLELREAYRPNLRLVVMSATLGEEAERLAERLSAPLVQAEGRAYPVEVRYEERPMMSDPCERAPQLIAERWRALEQAGEGGSLLAFFPGKREIERAQEALKRLAPSAPVYPLYGGLKPEQQRAALNPNAPPRVILSTNIAETSVTIEGVVEVIDTGLARQTSYDPKTGLERLALTPIALDAATQRAGRAGRVRAGRCWRLWSALDEHKRSQQSAPEVARADLSSALLSVASWAGDWRSFAWYERPPEAHLMRAEAHLKLLGALDERGRVTKLGEALNSVSLEPALALALAYGELCGCAHELTLIATLSAQERDLLELSSDHPRALDPWLRVEAFEDLERGRGWPELRRGVAERARLTLKQLKRQSAQLNRTLTSFTTLTDQLNATLHRHPQRLSLDELTLEERVCLALTLSHPHRVAKRRARDERVAALSGGGEVSLSARALEGSGAYFMALGLHQRERERPRVTLALPTQERYLSPTEVDELRFVEERGAICKVRARVIGELRLEERVSEAPFSDEASERMVEVLLRAPWRWLNVHEEVRAWLMRARWLCWRQAERLTTERHTTERHTAALTAETKQHTRENSVEPWWGLLEEDKERPNAKLSERTRQLLTLLCSPSAQLSTPSLKRLSKLELLPMMKGLTPQEELRRLALSAPERFELPTGQAVKVRYELGQPPVVEAYLQAFFGEAEHPTLGEGAEATPLQLHLLAPNRRPAQITSDLPSFWANAYADVRKQLRARYAKHHWPEDPLSMGPQRGAKRRH